MLLGHGALPYRAAHRAANPSQQQPMHPPSHADLDLVVPNSGTRVPTVLDWPLWAKPAYQVPPVYDHSAIFTPLPTNSQAVSDLAGKKTLARFSYTGLLAVSHRAPFHPHTPSLPSLFPSLPIPVLGVPRKLCKSIASFFSPVLDATDQPTTHRHCDPLRSRTFQRARRLRSHQPNNMSDKLTRYADS